MHTINTFELTDKSLAYLTLLENLVGYFQTIILKPILKQAFILRTISILLLMLTTHWSSHGHHYSCCYNILTTDCHLPPLQSDERRSTHTQRAKALHTIHYCKIQRQTHFGGQVEQNYHLNSPRLSWKWRRCLVGRSYVPLIQWREKRLIRSEVWPPPLWRSPVR